MDWFKQKLPAQSKERGWNLKRTAVVKLLNHFYQMCWEGGGQLPTPSLSLNEVNTGKGFQLCQGMNKVLMEGLNVKALEDVHLVKTSKL